MTLTDDVTGQSLRQIGALVRDARRHHGLTQEQLAERVGVTQRSIQGYEAGAVVPYKHFKRLEEVTGRTLAWFLGREEDAGASNLADVGERLVALVEQVAAEAERLAEIAARLEERLAAQESARESSAPRSTR